MGEPKYDGGLIVCKQQSTGDVVKMLQHAQARYKGTGFPTANKKQTKVLFYCMLMENKKRYYSLRAFKAVAAFFDTGARLHNSWRESHDSHRTRE